MAPRRRRLGAGLLGLGMLGVLGLFFYSYTGGFSDDEADVGLGQRAGGFEVRSCPMKLLVIRDTEDDSTVQIRHVSGPPRSTVLAGPAPVKGYEVSADLDLSHTFEVVRLVWADGQLADDYWYQFKASDLPTRGYATNVGDLSAQGLKEQLAPCG